MGYGPPAGAQKPRSKVEVVRPYLVSFTTALPSGPSTARLAASVT